MLTDNVLLILKVQWRTLIFLVMIGIILSERLRAKVKYMALFSVPINTTIVVLAADEKEILTSYDHIIRQVHPSEFTIGEVTRINSIDDLPCDWKATDIPYQAAHGETIENILDDF